jgi:hypothetical protein
MVGGEQMGTWAGNQMTATEGHRPRFPRTAEIVAENAAAARRVPRVSSEERTAHSKETGFSAPPCFFHRDCGGTAEIEKQGKAVCRSCARGLNGVEYPLREPSCEPLYSKPEELVLQLEMKEGRRKRGGER